MCAAAATAHTDAGFWAIIYEIKLVIWKLKLGACNNKITFGQWTAQYGDTHWQICTGISIQCHISSI